ncbi:MAG: T9SS type A sorting domain-containing protein [Chitinophagales bacterium]
MRHFSTFLTLFIYTLLNFTPVKAQPYCNPTFGYGCYSWNNHSIQLDSINWIADPYNCEANDYTTFSTTLAAGNTYNMQVTNANWCGCGVWIDFNQDYAFDNSENLFYLYTPSETNTYNFSITMPALLNPGTYRMRVIAGWGTDCLSESANGYGACGSYQYGNFDDFTIHVAGFPTGINTTANSDVNLIAASPNPVVDFLEVTVIDFHPGNNALLQLVDVTGSIIQSFRLTNEKETIDMSSLARGIYLLRYVEGQHTEIIKVIR